jgi:hypothetical protein
MVETDECEANEVDGFEAPRERVERSLSSVLSSR